MSYLTSIFAENVFSETVMKERLPNSTFKKLKSTINAGEKLQPDVAEVVANAMKDWAVEKGATHYTHWFQPMTSKTAGKYDSFIEPTGDGRVIMEFSGKQLIQSESDASSFPNGGIRATFEGRGYTVWDATSPAFIKDGTLYIPTAFISYTGEALDKKTPLLRSMEALSTQCVRLLRHFGDTETKRVVPTVGPEQEYFLIDKRLYQEREDLILTGRTILGARPPKGQELDDHYFGSIKERISAFMKEFDEELWKLGILAKTEHNEVAPAQHEMAPIFQTTNISTDQNQLVMDTLIKVANRHELACLLHEKPFAGVNGSGKHNNWSISTEKANLLEPGKTPHENAQFLTFLVATISAVNKYAPLLRIAAASAGNDHRLGANEAPPAIVSIFLGEQLTDVINQIKNGALTSSSKQGYMDLGVATLPNIPKDVTDRNRTSPFAFTGNKFEFRMLGSADSISSTNIVLNTILADELMHICDELEAANLESRDDFHDKLSLILERLIKENHEIIFDGDGYNENWVAEAKKRGLPNYKTSVEAISHYSDDEFIKLFERQNVFNKTEIFARQEIMFENYIKVINIEALTMISMVKRQIIPAVVNFLTDLARSKNEVALALKSADTSTQDKLILEVSGLLKEVSEKLSALEMDMDLVNEQRNAETKAFYYREHIFEKMERLRLPCDKLEELVGKTYWPYATYTDLLYRV